MILVPVKEVLIGEVIPRKICGRKVQRVKGIKGYALFPKRFELDFHA